MVPIKNPLQPGVTKYYDDRAAGYDSSDPAANWHLALALDFITWVSPFTRPTSTITSSRPLHMLDLCCGTGMVAAAAVSVYGADNVAIDGVDVSTASLAIARPKLAGIGAKANFHVGSVLDLDELDVGDGKRLVKGGYDLITCCSAFVLLPGPYEDILAIWGEYLAPGGAMIIDVPSPDTQIIGLLYGRALQGLDLPLVGRDEFNGGEEQFKGLIEKAGLNIGKVWDTGPMKTVEFKESDWEEKWEKCLKIPMPDLGTLTEKQRSEAKERFRKLWIERAEGGIVKDTTSFVMGIAIKT